MVQEQELQKARVTELHVRMDCNGCVQRIKRAMHSVDGVNDVYIDLACQKLTVVGTADPEKIVKAIKKARKIATVCSHKEQGENTGPQQPPPAEGQAPSSDPPASDAAEAHPTPPPDPPTDDAPPQDNASPGTKPTPEANGAEPSEPKDVVGEIHMVHHYPYDYVHREQWSYYHQEHEIMYEHPNHVSHSYRTPRYVWEYGYSRSPPRDIRYTAAEAYDEDGYHYSRRGGDGNQITSIFSDENPNACRIV